MLSHLAALAATGSRIQRLARHYSNINLSEHINKMKTDMAAALESVEYVQASAAQAYLECDPAERQPGDVYTERYTRMAKEKADAALEGFGALEVTLGSRGAAEDALHSEGALLMFADTLLARDRLAAQLQTLGEKMRRQEQAAVRGRHERQDKKPEDGDSGGGVSSRSSGS